MHDPVSSEAAMWLLAVAACAWPGRRVPPSPPAPPRIEIRVEPDDAAISIGTLTGIGRVAGTLHPGDVALRIDRAGYAPWSELLALSDGAQVVRDIALLPLTFPAVLRVEPHGTCTLSRGETVAAPPEIPGGRWTMTCAAEGFRTETAALDVTGPLNRTTWLDPVGQHLDLLRVFPTGRQPKAVLVVGDELWVTALDGPPSVIVHDLATGAIAAEITLGEHGAVELATNADHTRVWASQMETARVYEIDRASRSVVRVLQTRSNWSKVLALSPDERTLFVSNWNFADISAIDLATGDARRIATVDTPRGLWPTADGRSLYVAGYGTGDLARIDLLRGTSRTVWSSGGALRALASDGSTLYVSDMHSARIYGHDLATGQTRALGRTDPNPNSIALSPDGHLLFVSNRGPNGAGGYLTESGRPGSVVVLEAATGERLETVHTGSQTTGIDLSEDGTILVVSDFRDDRIRVWAVPPSAAW